MQLPKLFLQLSIEGTNYLLNTDLKVPIDAFGYYIGYFIGMLVDIIISAIFTGGAKTVADVLKIISKQFTEIYKFAKSTLKYTAKVATNAIEYIIDLLAKLRNSAKNIKPFLDEILEELRKLLKSNTIDDAIKGLLKLSDEAEILLKKYADNAVLGFTKLKRPTVVSVLEGKGKRVFAYSNKAKLNADEIPKGLHPLVKKWLNEVDDLIKQIPHHGKCAEPAAISKWLWEIDPKGKMKIDQARKEFEGVVSKAINIESKKVKSFEHATHKVACNSCNPLLKYFNIKEVH